MTHNIKTVAVIGAGAMGSGIAAQAANAGYKVILLDKRPDGAAQAIERMKKAKPTDAFNAGFMHPSNAKNIETGCTDDDMAKIAEADIIIEAVFEDINVKHNVFREIHKHAKKDAIISSNTSTIELEDLVDGFPKDFKERFINTHFFNPVRFMHLLEIIDGRDTDPEILKAASDFGDRVLGKKVIRAKDAPGFIANRIGIYAIERAKAEALKKDMPIEDIDAIFGPSFGFPHLGLFKLADEVGVDIVYHVGQNLQAALPADDDFHGIYKDADKVKEMLDDGYTGKHKGKGGFYRVKTDENGKPVRDAKGKPVKQVRDLGTNEFRDVKQSEYFKKTVWKKHGSEAAFFDSNDRAASVAWPVLRDTLLYVLNHAKDIAYDIQSIDDAMRAGYNWQHGPFQLIDKFGLDWFKNRLEEEGVAIPALLEKANGSFYQVNDSQLEVMNFDGNYQPVKREDGVINLEDIKRKSKPLVTHHSASLWDIGDGIVCLEFHSQQNSIDPSILHVINESIKLVSESNGKYKGMVVYNDAPRFSVGANLKLVEIFMNVAENKWAQKIGLAALAERGLKGIVHELIYQGQAVYTALNQAPFPVIGAPKGNPQNMAFGGGCEVLLSCDAIQAGPEQVMGLPETGLGLLPAWAGSARYLERAANRPGQAKGPMPAVIEAGMALGNPMSSIATSSQDAKKKLWLRKDDGITMNPDRVLADAKAKALAAAPDYKPKPLPTFNLPGPSGKAAIRMNVDKMYMQKDPPKAGGVNHVDVMVMDRLADVLTGGETLEKGDVDHHVADNKDQIKKLIDERKDGKLGVNPTIAFNFSRMMQLERDNFMAAFMDKKYTWKRVHHTLKTNAPLREDRPDDAPTPKELRDNMEPMTLPRRDIEGAPLSGNDAAILKAMADMTAAFYKQNEQKTMQGQLAQAPRTLMAIQRVFKMV